MKIRMPQARLFGERRQSLYHGPGDLGLDNDFDAGGEESMDGLEWKGAFIFNGHPC